MNPHPPYLESDDLAASPIRHGFFGREGGVSRGIYAGLNCGPGSKDQPRDVRENRRRAASALGFGVGQLITLYQVHSPNVLTVVKPFTGTPPEADGLVTKTPNLLLGILTADCVPVLFADAAAKVVGACHAGWKGAFSGVLENTIESMVAQGAVRERIAAAIGPAITFKSYEVGPEFRDRFLEQSDGNRKFFSPSPRQHHFLFDLPSYIEQRLARAGLQHIGQSGMDTLSNEAGYFSYRRTTLRGEGDYGRQLSAIGILEEKNS